MPTTLTLRDANQHFARCVREVEAGAEFVITRNGRPVARLVPVAAPGRRVLTEAQTAALERLMLRWSKAAPLEGLRFDRQALYDERLDELDRRREAHLRGGDR